MRTFSFAFRKLFREKKMKRKRSKISRKKIRENAKCENYVKTMSVIAVTINCSKELVEFSALIPQYLQFLQFFAKFLHFLFHENFAFFAKQIEAKFSVYICQNNKCQHFSRPKLFDFADGKKTIIWYLCILKIWTFTNRSPSIQTSQIFIIELFRPHNGTFF